MKFEIMDSITRGMNKAVFSAKQKSPEILIGAGIVLGIAAAVSACKATLKVEEVVDDAKEKLDKIHEAHEHGATEHGLEYTEEDYQKDLVTQYTKTGVEFVKLYGPAVVMGCASIGCILGGHHILTKRNAAITAAYTAVSKAYDAYNERVTEKYGKEAANELKYGLKTEKVVETHEDENGNTVGEEKEVTTSDPVASLYSKFFDEASRCWKKNAEYNLMFLRSQQNLANDRLVAQGYLFLNDVYDMLDIDRTEEGQVVGWVYDKDHPTYIDFGIYNGVRERSRAFVNGYEPSILLDFNVQGIISDKFTKYIRR